MRHHQTQNLPTQSSAKARALLGLLVVPLVVGFALGWHQAGMGRYTSTGSSVVMWIVHMEIYWVCAYASTILAWRTLESWIPWPVALLTIGSILSLFIARPVFWVSYETRVAYSIAIGGADRSEIEIPFVWFDPTIEFVNLLAALYLPDVLLWFLTAYIIHRLFGLPVVSSTTHESSKREAVWRSDHDAKSNSTEQPLNIPFLGRINADIGQNVLYLKADGHYVSIVTDIGHDLIYYRFGDAISQLGRLGYQTHRSYWIAKQALESPDSRITQSEIMLSNGDTIPIGQTYRRSLKEAGFLA